MPKPNTILWLVALLALGPASGCGDDGTTTDAGDDRAETLDDAGEADVPPDAEADTPAEIPADVEPDVATDTPADTPADVEPDVPADTPADVEPDVPADTPPDVEPDVPADAPTDEGPEGDAAPSELRVAMTSSDAWANLMPGGSSSHAIFVLELVNGGTTDVTGFTALDGDVSLSSDGTTVFAFTAPTLTRSGGGAFDGRIAAGATVTLDGNGTSRTGSGAYCDEDVKVMVRVRWDDAPADREVSGNTISLMCVY
jgi:hypothetical protein